MIDARTTFCRNAAFADRAVESSAVLVNVDAQVYFSVNRVGARIWALLETPKTLAELVQILTREFAVEESICRRETEAYVRQLIAKQLVVVQK